MIDLNDVLLAMSNIPVDDPIAEIWGRGLQGGYKIIEYTGSLPITIKANGDVLLDYRIYGNTVQTGTPTPENPIMPNGCGERTENLVFTGWAEDFVTRAATDNAYITQVDGRTCLCALANVGYGEYDTKYMFKTDFKESTVYTLSFEYMRPSNLSISSTIQVRYTDGTAVQTTAYINDNNWHKYTYVTASGKTVKSICCYYSSGYVYIDVNTFMVVEGSTPPDTYIPYGYKLPMTVYKQEFMVTGDMLDQSNWVLSPRGVFPNSFFMFFDISDLIRKEECVAKIYENFSAGYTPEKLVVALTDDMYTLLDTKYRILNSYGVILNKKFDFSSWDKIYLCIGYGDGFTNNAIKQSKIDELFENWKILIAPTSQMRESPVYIGENQLDSVEGVSDYVDKSSGKVVRMIGEYTFTGDESFSKYGNSDVFYTSKTIDPVGITTVNTTTMRCDHPAFTAIENKDTRYWLNPEADDICCFLPGGRSQVFLRSTSNFTTAAECKAYLKAQFDNGTPVKISYWLKTPVEEDPPVPFPEIPTIDGTTIIDYDGTPKPSQMYVKYKGKG